MLPTKCRPPHVYNTRWALCCRRTRKEARVQQGCDRPAVALPGRCPRRLPIVGNAWWVALINAARCTVSLSARASFLMISSLRQALALDTYSNHCEPRTPQLQARPDAPKRRLHTCRLTGPHSAWSPVCSSQQPCFICMISCAPASSASSAGAGSAVSGSTAPHRTGFAPTAVAPRQRCPSPTYCIMRSREWTQVPPLHTLANLGAKAQHGQAPFSQFCAYGSTSSAFHGRSAGSDLLTGPAASAVRITLAH